MRYLSALLIIGILLSPCRADEASNSNTDESTVRQAQAIRFQAMIDMDVATLETLLADDLTYTHSTGLLETKDEFLEAVQSRTIKYLSISPTDMQIRIYDDFAVSAGITAVRVHVGGQDLAASLRITEVHRRNGGSWQLVAYQSTRIPEES